MEVKRMAEETPTKPRRGGQPGNQNAKGKAGGNRTERRHRFARGNRLGGAPVGNKNAQKKRLPTHVTLLKQFAHDPETARWIEDHAELLDAAGLRDDDERDRATFDGYLGLTPEALAKSGQEYRRRLFTTMDVDEGDDENLAA
jgi:hypothetical protein